MSPVRPALNPVVLSSAMTRHAATPEGEDHQVPPEPRQKLKLISAADFKRAVASKKPTSVS
ncbi:hypothetical protein HEK616_28300 [Streptomyces nigrescens]|uniref:Uncharacterized protein n=1 Tax=Streptomyces nigrescens TaxID=1920 RepID=A0ABN6QT70_STRNI|nr:hypothetical protein HEK616_28300 [Streptomyces nigrescens]